MSVNKNKLYIGNAVADQNINVWHWTDDE